MSTEVGTANMSVLKIGDTACSRDFGIHGIYLLTATEKIPSISSSSVKPEQRHHFTCSSKCRNSSTSSLSSLNAGGGVNRSSSTSLFTRENKKEHTRKSKNYSTPVAGAKPIKSCLSVTNLADSLNSCGTQNPRRRNSMPNLKCAGKMKRNVSFHKVELRRYRICVGDNPSTQTGPPISLDWSFDPRENVQPLDHYEFNRGPRRSTQQMRISGMEREARLIAEGFSTREILRAEVEKENDQRRRSHTNQTLHLGPAQEVLESAGRKMKRIVTLTSKKKEQERLWKDAQEILMAKSGSCTGAAVSVEKKEEDKGKRGYDWEFDSDEGGITF